MIDLNDFVIKGRYKKHYRFSCDQCGGDRGHLRKSSGPFCKSCAISNGWADGTQKGMLGKNHTNKEKFRKGAYSNVDYNDSLIEFSPAGNRRIYFKQTCPQCGEPAGYRKLCDANSVCLTCSNKNRIKHSPEHRKIRQAMKRSIHDALKRHGGSKDNKSINDILPYTASELKTHIESQFEPWMNWDNWGNYDPDRKTWHIDHIFPDSLCNYTSTEDTEFLKSWSLSNLRPFEALANIRKSNKILPD